MKTFMAIAILLVLALDISQAQAGTFLNRASVSTNLQGLGAPFGCFEESSSAAAICSSTLSNNPTIFLFGSASAFVDSLGLHARSSVQSTSSFDASGNFLDANSDAQFGTLIPFFGALPSEVVATIRITTEGSGGLPDANITNLSLFSGSSSAHCSLSNAGSCDATIDFDPSLGLDIGMQLFTQVDCLIVLGKCEQDANYSDTSFISSIVFTDVNGHPLDLAFALDDLPYHPNGVPEPGTLASLAVALGAMGFARRRK